MKRMLSGGLVALLLAISPLQTFGSLPLSSYGSEECPSRSALLKKAEIATLRGDIALNNKYYSEAKRLYEGVISSLDPKNPMHRNGLIGAYNGLLLLYFGMGDAGKVEEVMKTFSEQVLSR